MTPTADDLLDRLNRGDAAVVEELCAAYAPYLRAVARGHLSDRLRSKFDSADVVQSVWVQVIRKLRADGWRIETEAELRGLLATIARRRAISRARHHATALRHEDPAGPDRVTVLAAGGDRPSESAQADDLWQQMLRLCPPDYHDILRHRRDGLSAAEIADRTGLHEGSVRRILRRLARDLALAGHPLPQNAGCGTRDAE